MNLGKKKKSATADNRINGVELREKIESRAYDLWLADGCRHGNDLKHWLQTQRELSVLRKNTLQRRY